LTKEQSKLTELPESWVWTNLGFLARRINPGFPSGKWKREDKEAIPHLRPMNINVKGDIDLSNLKYVSRKDYDPLLKGDVLFNNTNSPRLLGKTAVIEKDTNWAYSNHMTRIRLVSSAINQCITIGLKPRIMNRIAIMMLMYRGEILISLSPTLNSIPVYFLNSGSSLISVLP